MDCQIILILKVLKPCMGEDQVLEMPTHKHTMNSKILDDSIIYALLIIHLHIHQIF